MPPKKRKLTSGAKQEPVRIPLAGRKSKPRKPKDRPVDEPEGPITDHDKLQLVKAIKEDGMQITQDPDGLRARYLPNRSLIHIKRMISRYATLGKAHRENVANGMATKKDANKEGPGQGGHTTEDGSKLPIASIDKWISILRNCIQPTERKSNMSFDIYSQVLWKLSKNSADHNTTTSVEPTTPRPNYSVIYEYLAKVFEGSHPGKLPPTEMAVLRQVLQEMSQLTESENLFHDVIPFFKDGHYAKKIIQHRPGGAIQVSRRVEGVEGAVEKIIYEYQKPDRNRTDDEPGTSSQAHERDGEEKELGPKDLKRMQLLVEYLNPLGVPRNLLEQLSKRVQRAIDNPQGRDPEISSDGSESEPEPHEAGGHLEIRDSDEDSDE